MVHVYVYSTIDLTLSNNSLDCEVQIVRTKDFRIAGTCSKKIYAHYMPVVVEEEEEGRMPRLNKPHP